MTRKLGWLILVAAISLPAAAGQMGKISGYVRDSAGVPQMGAAVELYGSGSRARTFFTDAHGFYSITNLAVGLYQVKVTAPSFLPSLKEDIQVRTGANLLVNVTLNTLFEALQLIPAKRKSLNDEDEDWKWTLRSMSNRPVLRIVDDGPLVVVSSSENTNDKVLKARVAFIAGAESDGLGSGAGMRTVFSLERSIFGNGTMSFDGNLDHTADGALPGAVLRASYSHQMADGSEPEVVFTLRRFSNPELQAHGAAMQALSLSMSNTFSVAGKLDLKLGTELQSIQLAERGSSVYPFGSATYHLTPDTLVEYGYATFEPDMRRIKGFDSAPSDLSESGPRVSMSDWKPVMEHARHHELSISRRLGKNNLQVAVFSDHVKDPALNGTGEVESASGLYLPDFSAGTFAYTGRDLNTRGIRAVFDRKLNSKVSATFDYAYGGVLDVAPWTAMGEVRDKMTVQERHALSYRMHGTLPWAKGQWIASYRWTSGSAVTPVDMFNAGPGQSDPFFSIFVRQPIPGPCHMEALVDVRNLLAQGYVPVMGQDGHTVYLVQSARAVRGGLSFTF